MRERPLLRVVLVATGLAAAGCRVAGAAATTVEAQDGNRFDPATVTVAPGTTVVWRNASTELHTVSTEVEASEATRVPDGAARWASEAIEPDGTYTRELTTPGVYLFACEIHGEDGMVGVVRVEP